MSNYFRSLKLMLDIVGSLVILFIGALAGATALLLLSPVLAVILDADELKGIMGQER